MHNIIDRLSLQSDAFQESFNILSRSKDLEELAKKFFHVLRGNLLVINAIVYFKHNDKAEWKILFSKSISKSIPVAEHDDEFVIADLDHSEFKLNINLPLIDKACFKILLGSKLNNQPYDEFDKMALQFFLQQLGSAYQFHISRKKEKQLIFSLNHRVLQLNSLIDTGIEVARLQEGSRLLNLALERVLALTNASKGLLVIKSGRKVLGKYFFPFHFKIKDIEKNQHHISTTFSFADKKYTFHLLDKESREGPGDFEDTDQLLLDAFARQVHASIENHYLYEQSLEKELIDREISVAGNIQKNIIPEKLPEIKGFDHFGINIPTKFIGGDYYDCIPLKDGSYVYIMADVSGKGIAAGLLVSTLHASVHAYLDNRTFELEALVQKLNEIINSAATIDKYITAVFAILNPKTGEFLSVNAGHNPTYILRKNRSIEELVTGGIPLGMMRQPFPYESLY